MLSSIASAASPQTASPVRPATITKQASGPKQSSGSEQSSGRADTDSVHLSSTARAQLSAAKATLQEAETSAQTAKEAMGGDLQAKRLLAREAPAGPGTH